MTGYNVIYQPNQSFRCVDYLLTQGGKSILGASLYDHPQAPFVGLSFETNCTVQDFLRSAVELIDDPNTNTTLSDDKETVVKGIAHVRQIPERFTAIRVTSEFLRVGLMNFNGQVTMSEKDRSYRVGIETRVITPKLTEFLQSMHPTLFQDENRKDAVDLFLRTIKRDMSAVTPEGTNLAFEGTGSAIPMEFTFHTGENTLQALLYPNAEGAVNLSFQNQSLPGTRK